MPTRVTFADGQAELWTHGSPINEVPAAVRAALAPATHVLYEWTDYWIRASDADHLDGAPAEPIERGLFRLRFENRVGLCAIRLSARGRPIGPPLHVEVLTRKLPAPEEHVAFFDVLLADLAARAARLPFAVSGSTTRATGESPVPPSPLFALHFLLQHAAALRDAWQTIEARPHRALADHAALVPVGDVTEADADVLLDIARAPDRWSRSGAPGLAARLGGYLPREVWQRRSQETLDTPENRFVRAFLRELLAAAERIPSERWWSKVSADRRTGVDDVTRLLAHAAGSPMLAEVGAMMHFPAASRVLLRRDGYREARQLWQQFQLARAPLFRAMQHAIDLRDVATLYEQWAFFALAERVAEVTGVAPVIAIDPAADAGLQHGAAALFGDRGRLVYNGMPPSYSVRLRPDYVWECGGRPVAVFDAKFRFDRDSWHADATAKHADVHKMHAYRDALGVASATVIFAGDCGEFHTPTRGHLTDPDLRELLNGGLAGVGALALRPNRRSTP